MCGIAAIVPDSHGYPDVNVVLQDMLTRMKHRGPDGSGLHVDGKIGLGMTRLAIVGGESGQQPIWNEKQTVMVVCNGEIYNYQLLRTQLQDRGHTFSTSSDVEVIVHLYEDHQAECVRLLEGTFSFVLWDSTRDVLLACRDRIGVKPLYYTWIGKALMWASETQAFFAHPRVRANIDPRTLSMYLGFRFVPGKDTLLQGVSKLQPGHFALFRSGKLTVLPYWKPGVPVLDEAQTAKMKRAVSIRKVDELKERFIESIQSQLAPGVKSSVLLSGGIDSTALLAIQKLVCGCAPSALTVAFDRPTGRTKTVDYTELREAQAVARTFAADHVHEQFSAKQVLEVLPSIIQGLDEPIADPTAIPLWFVSRLAKEQGCRVVYSGEGLDELFNGYEAHRQVQWIRRLRHIPLAWRKQCAAVAGQFGLPGQGALRRSYEPVWKWYQGIGSAFTEREREGLMSHLLPWSDGRRIEQYAHTLLAEHKESSVLTQMTYFDVMAWLPENTLTKSDKMSMAHGVELRVPFLDKRIVEFAFGFTDQEKLRGKCGKYAVRQALSDLVPAWVLSRRKAGFPVPISAWMFGEWRDYVYQTLLDSRAATAGLFRREQIETLFATPPKQQRRAARLLWNLLTLEVWYANAKALTRPVQYGRVRTY